SLVTTTILLSAAASSCSVKENTSRFAFPFIVLFSATAPTFCMYCSLSDGSQCCIKFIYCCFKLICVGHTMMPFHLVLHKTYSFTLCRMRDNEAWFIFFKRQP